MLYTTIFSIYVEIFLLISVTMLSTINDKTVNGLQNVNQILNLGTICVTVGSIVLAISLCIILGSIVPTMGKYIDPIKQKVGLNLLYTFAIISFVLVIIGSMILSTKNVSYPLPSSNMSVDEYQLLQMNVYAELLLSIGSIGLGFILSKKVPIFSSILN